LVVWVDSQKGIGQVNEDPRAMRVPQQVSLVRRVAKVREGPEEMTVLLHLPAQVTTLQHGRRVKEMEERTVPPLLRFVKHGERRRLAEQESQKMWALMKTLGY
jgi:hypothetical protein